MNDQPIRVVIADDEALVRGGFRAILDRQPDMTIVAEATSGADAIRESQAQLPDVVLMDLRMPDVDGIEATRRLVGPHGPRVLIPTTFDIDEHVYSALNAGASGFPTNDTPPEQLADAVRSVAAGDTRLSPSVTRRLVETYTRLPPPGRSTPIILSALTQQCLSTRRSRSDRPGGLDASSGRCRERAQQPRWPSRRLEAH